MESIESRIKRIVADQLGIDAAHIDGESSFAEDLGADSLDAIQLVTALEEEFDTEISDVQAARITNIDKAIELLTCASGSARARPERARSGVT